MNAESLRTWLMRWSFNFFPAYRGSGAWVSYFASGGRGVRAWVDKTVYIRLKDSGKDAVAPD